MLCNFVFILCILLIQFQMKCSFPPMVSPRPRQVPQHLQQPVYAVMVLVADFWSGSAKALEPSDGPGCILVPDHQAARYCRSGHTSPWDVRHPLISVHKA